MSLMVSISGIRGIVGESFTPEVAVRYAAAFARYCWSGDGRAPEIVVGQDGRSTGSGRRQRRPGCAALFRNFRA